MKIIVRAPNWVGDAVLCTPALAALRKKYPQSYLSVLVRDRVSDCFLHNPAIDEIIQLSGRKGMSYWSSALKLRNEKYDMGFLFPNSFSSALFFRIGGVPEISGYRRDGRGFLLTDAIEAAGELLSGHQVDYYLNVVERSVIAPSTEMRRSGAGRPQGSPLLVWVVSEDEKDAANEVLKGSRIAPQDMLVGISPGASFGPAKRWPAERFAALGDELMKRYPAKILLLGTNEDEGIAGEIQRNMKRDPVNFVGKTNLRQLGALLSMCKLLVTNDSGAMHVAAAVKTPVVAIFGSTDPVRTGPMGNGHTVLYRGLDCSPCFAEKCQRGNYECLREIQVQDVFSAVEEHLVGA